MRALMSRLRREPERVLTAPSRPTPQTLRFPSDAQVNGVGWMGQFTPFSAPQPVLCFSPRDPDVLVTPTARLMGFAPVTEPEFARPQYLVVACSVDSLALWAFGQFLWTSKMASADCLAAANQLSEILVVMIDRPSALVLNPLKWVPPRLIWGAVVPVKCV